MSESHVKLGLENIGPFVIDATLSPRQRSILHKLLPFYTDEHISQIIVPMVTQKSNISLRCLDWLVTNFSKKHNIVCNAQDGALFNIYHSYKTSLTHFRRRHFDPFRRRQRIGIRMEDMTVETTVGQVNFLHWAHINGVLDYATRNAVAIELDMNKATCLQKTERKKQLASGVMKRRRELSKAPKSKCSVYHVDTSVSFRVTSDFDNK